jgi:HJR/Mrr/RecB family endonuclease
MNTINVIQLGTMQLNSESEILLSTTEHQKNTCHQHLDLLEKIKIENNHLVQSKEADSASLLKEIEVKESQIISDKPSILKPLKSVSNIFENRKIEIKISHLQTNNKKIQEEIQKIKTLLEINQEKIRETLKQIDETNAEISFIRTQKNSGFEIFDGKWVRVEDIPKLREIKIGLANNFENMSPFDFEHFVARLLQEMGYKTEVTKKTGDYGIDIIAKKGNKITAVQCKRHNEKNLVGNKLIQQLLGSMNFYHATQCIFVTTSYYTKPAIIQSQNAPIVLWDKDTFHELVKKYLLNLDIDKIFCAIEKVKLKEKAKREAEENAAIEKKRLREEKKEERVAKAEIKKQNNDGRRICPRCGGGKMKTRKYCSKCKKEIQSKKRYEYW